MLRNGLRHSMEDKMPNQFDALCGRLKGCLVRRDVPMAQYTSFRTGGCARILAEPRSAEALRDALIASKEYGVPFEIIGNGTNLLVSDDGLEASVFRIGEAMGSIRNEGGNFYAEAGAPLSMLSKRTVERGFMGLEWAAGIPGSVGGAVAMNAGAYGGEIAGVLKTITYLDTASGEIREVVPQAGDFAYRYSAFRAPERIVLSASFALVPDDGSAKARMAEYACKRRAKQPLAYPSAGSTFKRPEGGFAGALIEKAGLKGARIGGAEVSLLHAGFLINVGGATSADVYALMRQVQETVYAQSGIWLEPEVRLLGSFSAPDVQPEGGTA